MSGELEHPDCHDATDDEVDYLLKARIVFDPDRWLPRMAPTIEHFLALRPLIRMTPFTPESFAYLCRLVQHSFPAMSKRRFFACARVLRAQLRKAGDGTALHETTVRTIFDIYQSKILKLADDDEVAWCLSRLLRDQRLEPEAVHWLTRHAHQSLHVLNRLLRYPVHNTVVTAWAASEYQMGAHHDRRAEIIAKMIDDRIPRAAAGESPETLAWAVYYSLIPRSRKARLLEPLLGMLSVEMVVDLAQRLSLHRIFLNRLRRAAHRSADQPTLLPYNSAHGKSQIHT